MYKHFNHICISLLRNPDLYRLHALFVSITDWDLPKIKHRHYWYHWCCDIIARIYLDKYCKDDGSSGAWTHDLSLAGRLLYQLCYRPDDISLVPRRGRYLLATYLEGEAHILLTTYLSINMNQWDIIAQMHSRSSNPIRASPLCRTC